MKFNNKSIIPALTLVLAGAVSSCNNYSESSLTIIDPASYKINYGADKVWTEKYADVNVILSPFTLSHSSTGRDWSGFVPSYATDTQNSSDWEGREWTSITGGGIGGAGMPYLAVKCDLSEPVGAIPARPAAMIRMTYNGERFTPRVFWFTTTAQSFYRMKTGLPGVEPFSASDWAKIIVTGVRDGAVAASTAVWVARDGQILGDPDALVNSLSNGGGWFMTDLKDFGEVDYVYFQMQASRPDFVPTFVIGSFTYTD